MFFATASAEAGWDVQLSFMTRHGRRTTTPRRPCVSRPRRTPRRTRCAPGATIDKVWGALERGRVVSAAETDARKADDTSDFDDTDDGANGLRVKRADGHAHQAHLPGRRRMMMDARSVSFVISRAPTARVWYNE